MLGINGLRLVLSEVGLPGSLKYQHKCSILSAKSTKRDSSVSTCFKCYVHSSAISLVFIADLARSVFPVPEGLNIDFIRASSYHGTSTLSSGDVQVVATQKIPVKGRHVLLVRHL